MARKVGIVAGELGAARAEAESRLASARSRRWSHVQTVAAVAESLAATMTDGAAHLVSAAWLHDVGYGPDIRVTGFHPLDGANYLAATGWPAEVVNLVAHHTGARFEAEERGLVEGLARFPEPRAELLDAMCLADLTTGPDGTRVTVEQRLSEILSRYAPADPVHRAVTRASTYLRAAAARAAVAADLPDEWFRAAAEGVRDA